jgi:hypothetical protein
MTETTNPSLWNKPVNELTVADSVKINLVAIGVVVGSIAALAATATAAEKFQAWKANRRQSKTTESE